MPRRALLLFALVGCAGADAATAPQSPATATTQEQQAELGLHAGETMAFEVELAGVLVGEAQLAVGDIGAIEGGRRAIVVKSRAATAGAAALVKKIVDEATTVIDAESGAAISVETNVEMGSKKTVASAVFLPAYAEVKFQTDGKPPSTFRVETRGNQLHDAHSAMAQLRGWKATPGTVRTVHVIGGRRVWRVDVKYVGEETIGTGSGNRRAVVFEGVSFRARRDLQAETAKPSRKFRVWLSDDADRVPLKVVASTELGEVVMQLTDYARP